MQERVLNDFIVFEALRKQKRIPNVNPYLDCVFTKKIRCGACGSAFRRKLLKDGTAVWVCRRRNNHADACPVGRISEKAIQSAFLQMFNKLRQYKDIIFAPIDDDHFRTTVNVAVSAHFLGWIASLGGMIRIVSPDSVVEQMKNMIEQLSEQYDI